MSNLVIYGAGKSGAAFYEGLSSSEEDIEFFIDKYTHENQLFGKKIYKPHQVPSKNNKILVSVASYENEIVEELNNLGFSDIVTFQKSLQLFPKILNEFTKRNPHDHTAWYTAIPDEQQRLVDDKSITELQNLLSDEKSKALLNKIKSFRKNFTPEYYVKPDDQPEYFPDDLPIADSIKTLRMADCGAYEADSIMKALKQDIANVEYIISFEPDPNNFQQMNEKLSHNEELVEDTKIFTLPYGLWDESKTIDFNSLGSASSSIKTDESVSGSSIQIPVTTLDETLLFAKPNYIKMDIEGSEKKGLLGAKNILKQHQPILAICLYHKPEDLWEIPLLIEDVTPNTYDMYIRVHGHLCLETVLYCLPR